jgi:methionyl-tRNA formyltransferase
MSPAELSTGQQSEKERSAMRIVFMGTPEAAVPSLKRCLEEGHEIVAVWTQPDKPAGRGKKVSESPVKAFALAQGLSVHQPAKIKTDESKELFSSYNADLAVVVAYGRILPAHYLRAPRLGCINVHFSLLPLYRGAAPVNWAIINGEVKTGVTTMFVEEELDAGPILLQSETQIGNSETGPELMGRLAEIGAGTLSRTLHELTQLSARPQDERTATFAPILKKDDGVVAWSLEAVRIERLVRGLQPWPNAFTRTGAKRLIIWKAEPLQVDSSSRSGEVIAAHGDDLVIKCGGQTALRLIEVQAEGGRRMTARDFLNGSHVHVGDQLGSSQ